MASQSLVFERWQAAQAASDALWSWLKPEAMYERPVPERHRLIFYLGHLEAFDWNLLAAEPLGRKSFHPEWDQLFAFGIDPVDGQLPSDPPHAWPAVAEVRAYNQRVRDELNAGFARLSAAGTSAGPETERRLQVAIEHRWMHVETLSYLFHNLDYQHKTAGPAPQPGGIPARASHPQVEIPAGQATLGQPRDGDFGWDNEFDQHAVATPAFSADRFPVTNGDYLAFVAAGAQPPHFWRRRDGAWYYHGMFAEVPLPLDHPVYVTHAQATAYARWRGMALPTEAQWHRMAYATPEGEERAFPWGTDALQPHHGNFDLQRWDPVPVSAHPRGASAWGVEDLLGNGWEWTGTRFAPFAGFEAFSFYPGYSANFFDGQHFVMKGGSARTERSLLRRSFRNWFQPNYPYVYASFRCVSN